MSWDELDPSEAQLDLLDDLGCDEYPETMERASELIEEFLGDETSEERKARFRKTAMEKQPPSQKQLNYLASLGVRKVPGSAWQASQWINEINEVLEEI